MSDHHQTHTEAGEAEDAATLSDEDIESRPLDATPDAAADDSDDAGDVADDSDDVADDSNDAGDLGDDAGEGS